MEGANVSRKEIVEFILYGLRENGLEEKILTKRDINIICAEYSKYCNYFEVGYVIGKLDTFKRASCLMVAINKRALVDDEFVNASIAYDAALKMCEKPYWNVGANNDIPEKLEEVNFKRCFENDMHVYDTSKDYIVKSLALGGKKTIPLSYYLGLQMFYDLALLFKNDQNKQPEVYNLIEEKEVLEDRIANNKTFFKEFLGGYKKSE